MGGNALKGFVERKSAKDHKEITELVLENLHSLGYVAEEIKYFSEKESFGDADIVVLTTNLKASLPHLLSFIEKAGTSKIVVNSNVISFEYKKHQIDLILTEKKYYESSLTYFAYNDLGNLIGRIAHKLGFKYGHKGLSYVIRSSDGNVIDEIEVSTDIQKILPFLGFSKPVSDFNSLEEIFDYVSSSCYFNSDIYLLHNRNHVSRTRDAKRETYNKFLEWCTTCTEKEKFKFYEKNTKEEAGFKLIQLHKAFALFDGFETAVSLSIYHKQYNDKLKELLNGELVTRLTGLVGKDLGDFIRYIKCDIRTDGRLLYDNVRWIKLKFNEYKGT
jgi:hypothetical protein